MHPRGKKEGAGKKPTRRAFVKGAAVGVVGTALSGSMLLPVAAAPVSRKRPGLEPVAVLPEGLTRSWLGPDLWANRLQDWRLHEGRLECLRGEAGYEARTVALLTREMIPGDAPARLRVTAGRLTEGAGFCGFLIGVGGGELDYRAAALAQRGSGIGGGFFCTYESDGSVRFREHTDEAAALAFAVLPSDALAAGGLSLPLEGSVVLDLEIIPKGGGLFDVQMTAQAANDGPTLAQAVRREVSEAELLGGISLVSSTPPGEAGARWWFRDLQAEGAKIAEHPERRFGPILGTLFSLNGSVLKLSAQMAPVGEEEPREVSLETRPAGSDASWQPRATAPIQPGFTALFRLDGWDPSQDWEYRVVYASPFAETAAYAGVIKRDPAGERALKIGLFSCLIATARSLEAGVGAPELPQAHLLGRYTHDNIYFPHQTLIANAETHEPDLLVFAGDQFYEGNPTRVESRENPGLDYLYKWFLWVWSFREMTRSTPTIVLVDDHDVYHPNVWGEGGKKAPDEFWGWNLGGYIGEADFINIVQRTQCGHNPDPYDPTPVERGITVYYGAFRYGGVSFAVLEDRKFKTSPVQGEDMDVHAPVLLGARQEQFLEAWAGMDPGMPKVCLTQTCFACVQTSPEGFPLLDFDSNGYPPLARDRAVELLREAGALVLAGDQHLASIVRHGVDAYTDGPIQFSGPAGGSSWQRWFEPARTLPNGNGQPNTGDFRDAFGNKMRVLAVANPKISFAEYRRHITGRGQGLGDRSLKSEGYGIVQVDFAASAYTLACWPWQVDPAAPGARQFEGWPYRISFEEAGSETGG